MQQIKLSEATAARRRIPVVLVDATDGVTGETGITIAAGDMKLSKNGATEANHAGSLVELATGDYYYEATQTELDTVGYLTGKIVKAAARTFRFAVQVVSFDPYSNNLEKNVAFSAFMFMMTDSTNHNPVTGKTVTVTRSIDGGAFGAGTLSAVTEVANGWYKVDFAAADLNGKVIVLRATATGSDDTFVTIFTK